MAALVAERRVDCCLMHMQGEPRTMQRAPRYADVVDDVKEFLEERLAFAVAEGVAEGPGLLDPGIGFGKTAEHNLELLRRLDEIVALGRPLVIGTSRKSFLGRSTADGQRARARSPGRSPPTCSPSSGARACSASTTSRRCATRSRWRLLRSPRDGRGAAPDDEPDDGAHRAGPEDGRAAATPSGSEEEPAEALVEDD